MGKDNLMGLFETQDYISSEKHEWNVPTKVKDKVAKMVQKYNAKATKKNYGDSLLEFDETSLRLSGVFIPKQEKTSNIARRLEDGRNADLCGDIRQILSLCTKVCPQCGKEIPALTKVCECGKQQFVKGQTEDDTNTQKRTDILKDNDGKVNNHTSDSIITPNAEPQENIYWEEKANGMIKCPKCGCEMSSKSESCPLCGTKVVIRTQVETPNQSEPQKEEIAQSTQSSQQKAEKVSKPTQAHKKTTPKAEKKERTPMFAEGEYGVKYKVFNEHRITVEVPEGVTYYDTVLTFFEDFVAEQKRKPKNDADMCFTIDDIVFANGEEIEADDPRLGVSAIDVRNEVFSQYNNCKPLFEDKVNSGNPQIFVDLLEGAVDINECMDFANKHRISYALEVGIRPLLSLHYKSLIFSFDSDAEAAARFFCYVSDKMLSVPKDTPVANCITSRRSRSKAQKEFKEMHKMSAKDYAKGAMLLIKDKIMK